MNKAGPEVQRYRHEWMVTNRFFVAPFCIETCVRRCYKAVRRTMTPSTIAKLRCAPSLAIHFGCCSARRCCTLSPDLSSMATDGAAKHSSCLLLSSCLNSAVYAETSYVYQDLRCHVKPRVCIDYVICTWSNTRLYKFTATRHISTLSVEVGPQPFRHILT